MAHLLPSAVEAPAGTALTASRSAGPRSLRVLAAVLFLEWVAGTVAAALAAGVVAAAVPVEQPLRAAAAGWATVLAVAVVALLPLSAAVAVWRQAAQEQALRGASRVAVVAAAGVNLLAGLIAGLGLRSLDTVQLALPLVAGGLLVGYGCVVALRNPVVEPAGLRAVVLPRRQRWSGPTGAALLAGVLVVGIYAVAGVAGWLQYRSFAVDVDPPPELTVCTGRMDTACADTAARQGGMTVAWLPRGDRVRPLYTLLEPRFVQQDFETTGRVDASLFTALGTLPVAGEPDALAPLGEATGAVRIVPVQGGEWRVNVDWARDGVFYRLSVYPPGDTSRSEAIRQATQLAERVRYTAPPAGTPVPAPP